MTEQPDWIAALDQISAGFKDLAAILHSYYTNMLEIGFTEGQALDLTIAFQASQLHLAMEDGFE